MKKQNFLIIIFSVLFSATVAIAAESAATQTLQQYVKDTFNWGLGIAGLLAALSFAIGAVQYIVSDHAGGKDRMLGSVLGLFLVFASWIILQTINPKIINLELGSLDPQGVGVYFSKFSGGGELGPVVPKEVPETMEASKKGFHYIKYKCFIETYVDPEGRTQRVNNPNLLIWVYGNPNFEKSNLDNKYSDEFLRLPCNSETNLPGRSIKWAYEKPGVYFFDGDQCESGGTASDVFIFDQNPIPAPYYGNIRSLRIVNGYGGQKIGGGTGVILHENPKLEEGGLCDEDAYLRTDEGPGVCVKIANNISVRAADIFYMAKDPKTSGSGINFYSAPVGWQKDKDAGSYKIEPADMRSEINLYSDDMAFEWEGIKGAIADECNFCSEYYPEVEDCCPCETLTSCPGSIQLNGDYLINLWKDIGNNKQWCQSFRKNVDNLGRLGIFVQENAGNTGSGNSPTADNSFGAYIVPTTH